jgi:hypothetical protein
VCPVLGIELSYDYFMDRKSPNMIRVGRIVPSKPFETGNVLLMSTKAFHALETRSAPEALKGESPSPVPGRSPRWYAGRTHEQQVVRYMVQEAWDLTTPIPTPRTTPIPTDTDAKQRQMLDIRDNLCYNVFVGGRSA